MKMKASIIKIFKENIRDWKVLALALCFSPFFVLLMYLFYGGEPTVYKLGILNLDEGKASIEILDTLRVMKSNDEANMFQLIDMKDRESIYREVKDKNIDAGIIIPKEFSELLQQIASGASSEPAIVDYFGSLGNTRYAVAAIFSANIINEHSMEVADIDPPTAISETFIEKKLPLNEFESFVPGLISLSILMIIFTATATIVKENDKKTLLRLKMSRIGVVNYLAGISLVQVAIAVLALMLSYWTAVGLGYRPLGSFGAVIIVGIISSFSMVAISLIMASFLNTVFDVLTIGCFPFLILMFFSGTMFPLPPMTLLSIGGHSYEITDILPLKHTADAFNKILNYNAGVTEVLYELTLTFILTVIYMFFGLLLYNKRKFSKA